ncbi:MAG: hypothetical protein QOE93_618 [Actinomycetota bacterium]|nr:hypothetical protein [Actinomycetota bacterium]
MITEDDARRISLALPGTYEQESYGGRPSWRTKPRMFAWIRGEPEALAVWVESVEEKDELIRSDPEKFFTTPHYEGYAMVLVRLDVVDVDEATELVTDSWRLRAPKALVRAWDATHS